ncbi:MAG: 4-(cytidine 5'-diphospho)-2-C-methyl-D-erythritol kinase [Peptococcaceae bacterium]|nr:4-(cytidine 5'-diphospho)-2-C-methyl-D-erythritol kinase [Peptococcaceae bacterium]
MRGVRVNAYGKINLFLDCVGKREDGYHEVKMIMQSVRLHDEVYIKKAKRNVIVSDSPYVPSNKNNLAMRAAILLQEKYRMPRVAIDITKNIPVSAGMAGGSADAAAVLVGCNKLFKLGLSEEELMRVAAKIGSDVPFCVKGGTAIAEGRGERITALPELPKMHVVLARADYGVSTAAVYQAIRPEDIAPREDLFAQMCAAIEKGDTHFIEAHVYNMLEIPSFRIEPRTAERKRRIQAKSVDNVLMSGSGPTLFGIYATPEKAWESYKKMSQLFPNVYLTSTGGFDLINSRLFFR